MSCLSLFLFTNLSLLLSLSCFSQKGGCESLAHFFFVEKFSTRCAHSLSLSLSRSIDRVEKNAALTPHPAQRRPSCARFSFHERDLLSLFSLPPCKAKGEFQRTKKEERAFFISNEAGGSLDGFFFLLPPPFLVSGAYVVPASGVAAAIVAEGAETSI